VWFAEALSCFLLRTAIAVSVWPFYCSYFYFTYLLYTPHAIQTWTWDTNLKIIKAAVAVVLSRKDVERYRHQMIERIVDIVQATSIRSITVWVVRRCDLRCYFIKVLFAAIWQQTNKYVRLSVCCKILTNTVEIRPAYISYSVSQKSPTIFFVHNFVKCRSIFKILSFWI